MKIKEESVNEIKSEENQQKGGNKMMEVTKEVGKVVGKIMIIGVATIAAGALAAYSKDASKKVFGDIVMGVKAGVRTVKETL